VREGAAGRGGLGGGGRVFALASDHPGQGLLLIRAKGDEEGRRSLHLRDEISGLDVLQETRNLRAISALEPATTASPRLVPGRPTYPDVLLRPSELEEEEEEEVLRPSASWHRAVPTEV
jgi:hypothetical protein